MTKALLCALVLCEWVTLLTPRFSLAAADDFKLFVNNSQVLQGQPISVPCGSIVHFTILQSSDLPVGIDVTGRNDAILSFTGRLVQFHTAYNPGKYSPKVTAGDVSKQFQLTVANDEASWWLKLPSLSWQFLLLTIFLVLFLFGGLQALLKGLPGAITDFLKRSKYIKLYNLELTATDLGDTVTKAIGGIITRLDTALPNDIATRFLPSSVSEDIARYVHVFQYLDDVGLAPKQDSELLGKIVAAWNTVGNYYFQPNFERAKDAYNKAIALDSSDPTAYANLGMLYIMINKDHDTGRRYIEKALEVATAKNVSCSGAHMGMVVLCNRAKDREGVQFHCDITTRAFHEAVKSNRKDYWSLFGLGWSYAYKDDFKRAVNYTSLALREQPDFYAAMYNLACFYAVRNDPKQCMEALRGLLKPIRDLLDIYDFPNDSDFANLRKGDEDFKSFCRFVYGHTDVQVSDTMSSE